MHLKEIGKEVAAGAHAVLVLDGAGYHASTALDIPANISLLKLPPYAPELNPAENIWEYLRGNGLGNIVFDSFNDIVDKSCDAWMFFANDKPRIASITKREWATVNQ